MIDGVLDATDLVGLCLSLPDRGRGEAGGEGGESEENKRWEHDDDPVESVTEICVERAEKI